MSDKSDDILAALGKLKPNEMREIIENLVSQSGVETPTLAHLPNRLSCEDIIDRARLSEDNFYWHITDTLFECYVDSRDAKTKEEAVKFAYDKNSNQPWYPRNLADTIYAGMTSPLGIAEKVSSKEFRAWIRKD